MTNSHKDTAGVLGPAEYACWTCLDFGHLPGIGPCPDCRSAAYTTHVLALVEVAATTRARLGDVA